MEESDIWDKPKSAIFELQSDLWIGHSNPKIMKLQWVLGEIDLFVLIWRGQAVRRSKSSSIEDIERGRLNKSLDSILSETNLKKT